MSTPSHELIDRLASLAGIEPEYYDIWGQKHITSAEAKRAILASMGIEIGEAGLNRLENAKWLRLIDPVMVVSAENQPSVIPIRFPLEEGLDKEVRVSLIIEDETGSKDTVEIYGISVAESRVIDGVRHVRADVPNRMDRDMGYYTISSVCATPSGEFTGHMRLIISPSQCYQPSGRTWGLYANLYALRSERNWGVGDLSDLGEMVRWAGSELGADFIGINPLHAIPNTMPYGISPYSSTSRLYGNFIYLDMEKVSKTKEYKKLIRSSEFGREIRRLRKGSLIDYELAASLKMRALRAAFRDFSKRHLKTGTPRARDFRQYVEAEGRSLETFATFAAIEEHLKRENPDLYDWKDWPEEYRNPNGPAAARFRSEHDEDVLFYQYAQWLLDRQLRGVFDKAKALGMGVGIYLDLAVGSSGVGSDAWSYPEVFAFGAEAGAPPDAFNLNGQKWGFPPLIPEKLRETGYELFIQTIRSNLKHSGALRIDHALGLFRLFWVPSGMSPREGTYVRYPHEDLLRIIALESVRSKAVIIGEDLGTVGKDVRETLLGFGMLSYRLFYFERDWEKNVFLPPGGYPEMALTAVTTHDLPTLRGYWAGHDIEVKRNLGLYPDEDAYKKDIVEREKDRGRILDALGYCLSEGFAQPEKMTPKLNLCVHRHLARTPCRLVVVSLDDVLGVLNQQNMPGTIDAHPNWRQKYPASMEKVLKSRQARVLSKMFKEEGR